jgi:hypothetical protein
MKNPQTISELIQVKLADATKDWQSKDTSIAQLREQIKELEKRFAAMSRGLEDGSKSEIAEGFGLLRAYAGIIEAKATRNQ